jgi:hypothetical protein
LALLPICVIATMPAQANTASCPDYPTEVRISEKVTPPRIDDTKEESQLASMRFDGPVASTRRFLSLTGLTVSGITVDQEIRFASQGPESGPSCVWPSVVTVTLATSPVIYLVSSHGQCLKTLGLEHEKKHVTVDHSVITDYAFVFRNRVGKMVDAIGQDNNHPTRDPQQLRNRIEEKVNAIIAVTSDMMFSDWKLQQLAVDSAAEYQRISSACSQVEIRPGADAMSRGRSGG